MGLVALDPPLPLIGKNLFVEDAMNPLHCPVDFFLFDDQGRGKADDVVVRFLAEEAGLLEGFAVFASTRRRWASSTPINSPRPRTSTISGFLISRRRPMK